MKKKDIRLINSSIKHWERMRDGKPRKMYGIGVEEPYGEFCALCREYAENDCLGCPISTNTGKEDCEGTPYSVASWAYVNNGLDSPVFKKYAQKQIDYLKSLLDKP